MVQLAWLYITWWAMVILLLAAALPPPLLLHLLWRFFLRAVQHLCSIVARTAGLPVRLYSTGQAECQPLVLHCTLVAALHSTRLHGMGACTAQ